ncbi:Protein FAR-RED IMPAIRED RESPONSE 1, partial [Bienertia sinuspersici]
KGQPQNEENQDEGIVSEFEDLGDEIHTPASSDEEDTVGARRERRGDLVHADTDFSSFESVKKYSVHQGRNLGFVVSNRNKNNRVGVNCLKGCPFKLYGSWDTRRGTFVVKLVMGEHTCIRNIERNKHLKSSWVASQLLELFKARPHIPAKEIQELIRRGFRCVVKKGFSYKVKYYAHQQIHGSMKAHYNKLGNYIQAIKECSPNTVTELVTDPSKMVLPPIFERFFVGFEGLQKGWIEGCRKVICIDACFIKTFLGGQLLVAVGRDPNEQMFPICWALHLQTNLGLGDGSDTVILSDEHQAILSVVANILPKAEHRHCARHIFALWYKRYKGDEMKIAF